jgi:hypothetical protein
MTNKMMLAALKYKNEYGFSVLPVDGKNANLLKTWTEYQNRYPTDEEITNWWKENPNANVGIITGKISNITVVDFDWYKMDDATKEKVNILFPPVATPMVISGSGGEHRYFEYWEGIGNPQLKGLHVDIKNNGGVITAPPSVNGNEYKWHEKASIKNMSMRSFPENYKESIYNIKSLSSLYIGGEDKKKMPSISSESSMSSCSLDFNKGGRDNTIFHIANCLIKGSMQPENVQELMVLINKNLCNPPLSDTEVLLKIKSAYNRSLSRSTSFAQDVKELICLQTGVITSSFVSNCLQLSSREEKKNLSTVLRRMELDGIIEKTGRLAGEYRVIQEQVYEDWMNADYSPIKIDLPFHMQDYVDIFPGDMIVVAGVKNAGKTALALNFIELNLDKYDCYYHSSELVKQTFKLRVSKSKGRTLQEWSKVKMTSGLMMTNAKDKVVKDALNVFDYIEGDEGEFFKIPAAMARIHRALGNGIAVVCLQKPKERDFARGGEGTKDKAALYLTIDKEYPFHVCRITECKAFKEGGENPTGFIQRYKVAGGINLYPEGGLFPEEESKYRGFKK